MGIKRRATLFLVNTLLSGTKYFTTKRRLLNGIGFSIGENTKIVGPIECTGMLTIGDNCWVGKNLKVNGNGTVIVGNNCDIAPEVTFQTGGHTIGSIERRAGEGLKYEIKIGNGCWIGGRSTILGDVRIGSGCVVAACACVVRSVEDNKLIGGVPAKLIRDLT